MQTVRTVGSWQSTSEDLEDVPDDASWTTASSSEPVDVPLLPPPDPINHSRQSRSRPARPDIQEDSIARQCWICLEDEDKALAFVNACSCTLACHPQCLLAWVSSQGKPAQCPACRTPYIIMEQNPVALRTIRWLSRAWENFSIACFAGSLGGGAWLCATAYGCVVIKSLAGDEVAAALLFSKGWPIGHFVKIPLIPVLLVLGRTKAIDALLPFLPLTLRLTTSGDSYPHFLSDHSVHTYPPSPLLTLCLLPWARLAYLHGRSYVFSRVLGPRKLLPGIQGMLQDLGMEDDELEAAIVAEIEIEDVFVDVRGEEGAPRDVVRRRIGLGKFASTVVGALLLPFLAASAGSILFWISRKDWRGVNVLRRILGVQAVVAALGRGKGVGGVGLGPSTNWLRSWATPKPTRVIDPVWIRNTLGLGIVLIVRDVCQLIAGVQERQRKASRRVIGRLPHSQAAAR